MAQKRIYLGELTDLFSEMTTDDDVYEGMKVIGHVLKTLGYGMESGVVSEGKVGELYAVKYMPDEW